VVVLLGRRWENKKRERRSGRKREESQEIFAGLTWNEGNRVVRQGVWGSVVATEVELQEVEEEEGEELFRLHYYIYRY